MKTSSPATRERILQHGLDLMSRVGLSGVTLGTLAEQAGMSKSGLFAQIGSKEEVQIGLPERMVQTANGYVLEPAMQAAEGLPRLRALVLNWLGWSVKAGLSGGCPVAAGIFVLDDIEGTVRDHVLAMENHWRGVLKQFTLAAVERGHLSADLDVDQFVWELCGIYLSHHASLRFVRDPLADSRAHKAFESLVERSL